VKLKVVLILTTVVLFGICPLSSCKKKDISIPPKSPAPQPTSTVPPEPSPSYAAMDLSKVGQYPPADWVVSQLVINPESSEELRANFGTYATLERTKKGIITISGISKLNIEGGGNSSKNYFYVNTNLDGLGGVYKFKSENIEDSQEGKVINTIITFFSGASSKSTRNVGITYMGDDGMVVIDSDWANGGTAIKPSPEYISYTIKGTAANPFKNLKKEEIRGF
jgi:hypothetical protein